MFQASSSNALPNVLAAHYQFQQAYQSFLTIRPYLEQRTFVNLGELELIFIDTDFWITAIVDNLLSDELTEEINLRWN